MILENSPTCPNCHKADKVEKVSAIVADGFSTTPQAEAEPLECAGQTYYIQHKKREPTGVQPDKRSDGVYNSYNWNISPRERITISPLADRLLPSIEEPDAPPDYFSKSGCLLILFWPLKKLTKRLTNWTYTNLQADYKQKLRELPEAQRKWNELFYCYRCEGVFSEQAGFIRAGMMNNYLFDLELNRWSVPKT